MRLAASPRRELECLRDLPAGARLRCFLCAASNDGSTWHVVDSSCLPETVSCPECSGEMLVDICECDET